AAVLDLHPGLGGRLRRRLEGVGRALLDLLGLHRVVHAGEADAAVIRDGARRVRILYANDLRRLGRALDALHHCRFVLRIGELLALRSCEHHTSAAAAGLGELLLEHVLRDLRLRAGHRELVAGLAAEHRGAREYRHEHDQPADEHLAAILEGATSHSIETRCHGKPFRQVDLTPSASRRSRTPTSGRLPDFAPLSGQGARLAVGALDHARDLYTGRDIELLEQVPDVRLDGLRAQEQLRGDLSVGLPVHHQTRDLELALGEQLDAGSVELAALRPAVDPLAELAELTVGGVAAREG